MNFLSSYLKPIDDFLKSSSPTAELSQHALRHIYVISFGFQTVLSLVLALILAVLTTQTGNLTSTVASPVASPVAYVLVTSLMVLLLPIGLLTASVWHIKKKPEEEQVDLKQVKSAALSSSIALGVILGLSVWLCIFAFFIGINYQILLLLIAMSIMLYGVGFLFSNLFARRSLERITELPSQT